MTLIEAVKVERCNFRNAAVINNAGKNKPFVPKCAQPPYGVRVVLIVEGSRAHARYFPFQMVNSVRLPLG